MRVAKSEGERKIVVKNVPDPIPEKDEVLIRIQYCGICGSDLHIYKYGASIALGHESSGDIAEVGAEVKGWKAGDRVLSTGRGSCGKCYWCKQGKTGLCETQFKDFAQSIGSFVTYTKVKSHRLYKLPDHMSYEEATLVEPTSCALHAIRRSEMQESNTVAVLGLGTIGQLTARLAKALGAKAVYATDINPARLDLARGTVDKVIDANATNPVERILELTDGMGTDIVLECAGSVPTTQQSLALARKGGTIVIAGICFDWVNLPVSNIMLRELAIRGALNSTVEEFTESFNLIKDRKINVAPLATHKIPLDEINEAFEMALRGEGCKILIEP